MKAAETLSDGLEKLEQIVRPLVFDETITGDDFRGGATTGANSLLGRYLVYGDGSWSGPGGFVTRRLGTILSGQVEAEADYRARIASALNLDPILSEIKRMREALRPRNSAVVSDMPIHETMAAHADYVEARGFDMRSVTATYLREGAAELSRLYALSTLSPQEPDNG